MRYARSMKYDASAGQPPPNPAWERALDRTVLALARSPWGSSGHGRPRGIMHIFRQVERLIERGHPTHALRPGGLVRYEVTPLTAGRPLTLPGRPPVRRGEPAIALLRLHALTVHKAGAHLPVIEGPIVADALVAAGVAR